MAAIVRAAESYSPSLGFGVHALDPFDARELMANLFVMGDGYDGITTVPHIAFPSRFSGFGRPKLHWPNYEDRALGGDWQWRSFHATIKPNEVLKIPVVSAATLSVALPMPQYISQWKWALLWTEDDMENMADIDISVWDTCFGGTLGRQEMLFAQGDFDVHNRIRLTTGDFFGRCLEMHIVGYSIPDGDTREIYSVDFFSSGEVD
jgi:hypothetical protein